MLRQLSGIAMSVALLLGPGQVWAGGPPRLCLPIDGVSDQGGKSCVQSLSANLKNKVWQLGDRDHAVRIQEYKGQNYLTFPIAEDVALSDIEAALQGSSCSVPREKLRLFGHVILEMDAGKSPAKNLLADLEALPYVAVAETKVTQGGLLVTLDMPYPTFDASADRESVGWETFQRNDFSSDQAARSEPPAKATDLPSYETLRKLAATHHVELQDIRWSTEFACRAIGGVAVGDSKAVSTAKRGTP